MVRDKPVIGTFAGYLSRMAELESLEVGRTWQPRDSLPAPGEQPRQLHTKAGNVTAELCENSYH